MTSLNFDAVFKNSAEIDFWPINFFYATFTTNFKQHISVLVKLHMQEVSRQSVQRQQKIG